MTTEHQHAQHHTRVSFNRAFVIGIALNTAFVATEAFFGWQVNSLALLADALHNLSDVAGLMLAWAGALAGRLHADDRHTYGFKRASILAAFVNAMVLLVAMGWLGWEAASRLQAPEPTGGWTIMAVAGVGMVINGVTALMFMRASQTDLNIRAAFVHMAADALVSLAVVLGGALYVWQGWAWLDPLLSLGVAVVIVLGTWGLLRQSLHLLFDGVPAHIDLAAVRQLLLALPGTSDVHDLHVWAMGTSDIALTAHLVLTDPVADSSAVLHQAEHELHRHFEIRHVTLQLESPDHARHCALRQSAGCH
ncbi:MAG: cation diffusion facilitator family transporter [Rhodoferax sp.]